MTEPSKLRDLRTMRKLQPLCYDLGDECCHTLSSDWCYPSRLLKTWR